ncbi:MAG: site-specific integrase [Candidatus Aminicenantes bacterium]|nr:MAG: site-specific integrase [Candidatus Aminicenantes bacterium]
MPKRREGPVRNKQTGYYFFDEYVGFKPDKKRVRVSLRTRDPARAQWLWEQEYKRQWSKYYGIEKPERPQDIKFSDIVKEFVSYERDIKRIKEWRIVRDRLSIVSEVWGDPKFSEISKDHFTKLDRYLKENDRSENTINHYFSLLKTLYFYAIKKGYYKGENPVKEVKPYVIEEKRREYSPEELARILEAAEEVEKEARGGAMLQKYAKRIILLLLYTGMRLGEVLNLKWDNIKDDKIILRRTETKQKKEKVIPLTVGIKEILEDLRDKRLKNGYVIPLRRKGGQMKSSWADSVMKKIREHSGVQDFIFHNIRHTASTIMVSEALGKGVGLADVMKILGHSQVETTMKYLHSDLGRMKKAVEILEEKTRRGD